MKLTNDADDFSACHGGLGGRMEGNALGFDLSDFEGLPRILGQVRRGHPASHLVFSVFGFWRVDWHAWGGKRC